MIKNFKIFEKIYESIYDDSRNDTLFKIGDYVMGEYEYPLKIIHIYSKFNTPEQLLYECEVLYERSKKTNKSLVWWMNLTF